MIECCMIGCINEAEYLVTTTIGSSECHSRYCSKHIKTQEIIHYKYLRMSNLVKVKVERIIEKVIFT